MNRDLSGLIRIGKAAFAKANYKKAEQHLREALEIEGEYPDIHYTLGLIEHHKGNYSQAIERFEKAISLHPEYTEALLSMSITLSDMGMYGKARAVYDQASKIITQNGISPGKNMVRGRMASLHMELGELYLAVGQYDEAISEYRKAFNVAPMYPDLRIRLIIALREAGRMEAAMTEVETFLSEYPRNAPALIQKGVLLYLAQDRTKARTTWEEALYIDPLNKVVQVYLNTLEREQANLLLSKNKPQTD